MCVFDFDPDSKRMRIKSLHPGVTEEQVREATGFEIAPSDGEIGVTAQPSAEELHILRTEVDPTGARRREF
jgi:glutaconate CoA-transferase subunit B